ncbi:MAG: META domain-containing protein, partial [Nitrosospira sp.]
LVLRVWSASLGRFELDGQNLRLIRLGASMMPCPAFEQEQCFLQLLESVRSYRISGNHLELLDPDGEVAARFRGKVLRSQKSQRGQAGKIDYRD